MKVRCYEIDYDIAEEPNVDELSAKLPRQVTVEISKKDYESGAVQIVDLITQKTGWCVLSHKHRIVRKK